MTVGWGEGSDFSKKFVNGPPELQENGLNQKSSNGMDIKIFFNNPNYAYIQIRIIFFSLECMSA